MVIEGYLTAVFLILALDHFFGDPVSILGVPHPVILMGRMISWFEKHLYQADMAKSGQILLGSIGVVLLLLMWLLPIVFLQYFTAEYTVFWWIFNALFAAWLIAAGGLYDHVLAVKDAIATDDITAGREALLSLAGRKADNLSKAAILRTAGESLAENTSDAVVAPLLYFVLFGLPGIVAYKIINSFDSMWGYRNARYLYFGRFAARLDDLVNYVPARITAVIILVAGLIYRRSGYFHAWSIVWRDARRHPSPNAGYPESAMAGLSNLRFGGPRTYDGGIVETTWLGDGQEDWQPQDLAFCLVLYRWSLLVFGVFCTVMMGIME